MEILLLLTVLCTGVACFCVTLWFTKFGITMSTTGARLASLRGGVDETATPGVSVSLIESVLRRRGKSDNRASYFAKSASQWEAQLDRAGLTINVREYLVLRVGVGLGIAAALLILVPVSVIAPFGMVVGYFVVGYWVKMRVGGRRRKLDTQLIDALQTMASGLRAGFGLLQALEAAAEQSVEPLSIELRRTLRDIAVGSSVEQALNAMNERVGSPDFDIVISAVLIQRSVGGNLAEILENVAHTMRERDRIRGEIRALTAQQRLTGFVIGGVPVVLVLGFFLINRDYIMLLFNTGAGNVMLGVAIVFEFFGFLVIRKIVNIEI